MDQPKHCRHNIPETKKGAGPCDIRSEIKKRSGKPHWWCHTHGLDASAPDGTALEGCPGTWFDPVPDEDQLDIDLTDGEVAVWGAIKPAVTIGDPPRESGKVHVHQRPEPGALKTVDESYSIVRLHVGDQELTIEGMAAQAFSISELAGQQMVALTCPHCAGQHIDELMFATNPHKKHQCNACGRPFWDKAPSISNPLAHAQAELGLPPRPPARRVARRLDLRRADVVAAAMWASNPAIVSTMARPEDEGIHVHIWDEYGNLILDDTFGVVTVDGQELDEPALRALAVQRTLADGRPIVSEACASCGHSILSPRAGWIQATTTHECDACGAITRTRLKSFLNPLAPKRR